MFDHRTGAMIVLSLVIAAPALVLADAGHSRDNVSAHVGTVQLASVGTSATEAAMPSGMTTAEHEWRDRLNGVDFPEPGQAKFARTDAPRTGGASNGLSDQAGQR